MAYGVFGQSIPEPSTDRATELRRQARVVDDLIARLGVVVNGLPVLSDHEGWRGPASHFFAVAIAEQHERLGREVMRLDAVRVHLMGSAALVEAEAQVLGWSP